MIQLRGKRKQIVYILAVALLTYMGLNFLYVLIYSSSSHVQTKEIRSTANNIDLSLKNIISNDDGTIDLVVNLNVHELMKIVDNPKVGIFLDTS